MLALFRQHNHWAWILGAPARNRYACSISGELPEGRLALVFKPADSLPVERELARGPSGALEWGRTEFPGHLRVRVASAQGRTEVEVEGESNRVAALLVWLAPLGGSLLMLIGSAAAGLAPSLEVDALVLAGAVIGFALARAAWRRIAEDWEWRAARLAERVAERVRAMVIN